MTCYPLSTYKILLLYSFHLCYRDAVSPACSMMVKRSFIEGFWCVELVGRKFKVLHGLSKYDCYVQHQICITYRRTEGSQRLQE